MVERAVSWFSGLHLGWKLVIGYVAFVVVASISPAWGERHFFREYSLQITAQLIYTGQVVLGIILGAAAASSIYDKTKRFWLAAISFLIIVVSVVMLITVITHKFPRLEKRLDSLSDSSCNTEYDGRSSWCE